jgi:hypothetical protein
VGSLRDRGREVVVGAWPSGTHTVARKLESGS